MLSRVLLIVLVNSFPYGWYENEKFCLIFNDLYKGCNKLYVGQLAIIYSDQVGETKSMDDVSL